MVLRAKTGRNTGDDEGGQGGLTLHRRCLTCVWTPNVAVHERVLWSDGRKGRLVFAVRDEPRCEDGAAGERVTVNGGRGGDHFFCVRLTAVRMSARMVASSTSFARLQPTVRCVPPGSSAIQCYITLVRLQKHDAD